MLGQRHDLTGTPLHPALFVVGFFAGAAGAGDAGGGLLALVIGGAGLLTAALPAGLLAGAVGAALGLRAGTTGLAASTMGLIFCKSIF